MIKSPGGLTAFTLAGGISQTTVATPGVALTTATSANVTSKSLTAGTYLIWGIADFLLTAATTTEFRVGLSVVSATLPTQAGGAGVGPDPLTILPLSLTTLSDTVTEGAGPTILTIAATTTLYLVGQATFSAGTVSVFGTLNAMLV